MLTVGKDKVHLVEGQPVLLAEASELGLAPGEWPDFIAVRDERQSGFLFQKSYQIQGGGYAYVDTARGSSIRLEVLND